MVVHIEGCPLQFEKVKSPGDCRICPQGEGCVFLILLKKLANIEDSIRVLNKKIKA